MPESGRWLLSTGKIREATKVLQRTARLNGKKNSHLLQFKDAATDEINRTIKHIKKHSYTNDAMIMANEEDYDTTSFSSNDSNDMNNTEKVEKIANIAVQQAEVIISNMAANRNSSVLIQPSYLNDINKMPYCLPPDINILNISKEELDKVSETMNKNIPNLYSPIKEYNILLDKNFDKNDATLIFLSDVPGILGYLS